MKMIWSGWKSKEIVMYWYLVNQFHGHFRSKTLGFRKINSVFRDVKWCFNASWGLKGLSVKHTSAISRATSHATLRWFFKHTIWSLVQHTSSTTYAYFQNCYIFVARFAGCRARHIALDITLVCWQSSDFRVCRRVTRRVSNRARARL